MDVVAPTLEIDAAAELREIRDRLSRVEMALGSDALYQPPAERAVGEVLQYAAYQMGLSAADIAGPRRHARLFRARCAVCWTIDQLGCASLTPTARVLGNRDHTSIMNAIKRGKDMRGCDPAFRMLTDKMFSHFEARMN